MGELWHLYNISIMLEYQLSAAGIGTSKDLKRLGSKEAFRILKEKDANLGEDVLISLEGAVRDTRWYKMPKEVQDDLRAYFRETYE